MIELVRQRLIDLFAYRKMWKQIAVRFYIFKELDRANRWSTAISILLLAIGIVSLLLADRLWASAQATVTWLGLGLGSLFFPLYKVVRAANGLFRHFSAQEREIKKKGLNFSNVYLEKIRERLDGDETEGFQLLHLSNGDLISCSYAVDQYILKRPTIALETTEPPLRSFRDNNKAEVNEGLAMLLTSRAIDSGETYFFNEAKVSIQGNLSPGSVKLCIARTTYFATQISNYACMIIGYNANNLPLYDLTVLFPRDDGQLMSMSRSRLSNQIGVSTLCLDVDRHPIILLQGKQVFSNPQKLAPSGSGAMDWADLTRLRKIKPHPDLLTLVDAATIREFGEENGLPGDQWTLVRNLPIGYFRYVENGGLPEFISISTIKLPFQRLRHERREIEQHIPFRSINRSPDDVIAFCAEIDVRPNVSLPLRALCARLSAILRNELGPRPRAAVMEFWDLTA
jgi:hypothetical protein